MVTKNKLEGSVKRQSRKSRKTLASKSRSKQSTKSAKTGAKLTSSSRLGDVAELYAITWLWDNGYEVFHNSGCSGSVDIVAIKSGVIHLIDVKMQKKGSTVKGRTVAQKKLGVVYLIFDPVDRSLRWANHRS